MAILADDLTGALDCAAAFVLANDECPPFVALRPGAKIPEKCGIVSINADSRRLPADQAVAVVKRSVREITDSGYSLQYVKIDSTMRGHPGLEISECAKAISSSLVVLTPSFPATRRVVRDGTLLVNGIPLAQTDVGRDLLSPLKTSRIAEIVRQSTDLPVHEISLDTVRSGKLIADMQSLLSADATGPVIVCCDAETDSDLDALVAASSSLQASSFEDRRKHRVLFAGSAGLAFALSRAAKPQQQEAVSKLALRFQDPVIVVTASQRELADEQIDGLVGNKIADLQPVEFAVDATGKVASSSFAYAVAVNALSNQRNVVLRAHITGDLVDLSPDSIRRVADHVTHRLGDIVLDLISQHKIDGLVIIGGDTAYAILSAIEARGIVLAAEPLPGVAVGTIVGGKLDGVPIATKAGAFGDDQTLVKLFKHIN